MLFEFILLLLGLFKVLQPDFFLSFNPLILIILLPDLMSMIMCLIENFFLFLRNIHDTLKMSSNKIPMLNKNILILSMTIPTQLHDLIKILNRNVLNLIISSITFQDLDLFENVIT